MIKETGTIEFNQTHPAKFNRVCQGINRLPVTVTQQKQRKFVMIFTIIINTELRDGHGNWVMFMRKRSLRYVYMAKHRTFKKWRYLAMNISTAIKNQAMNRITD